MSPSRTRQKFLLVVLVVIAASVIAACGGTGNRESNQVAVPKPETPMPKKGPQSDFQAQKINPTGESPAQPRKIDTASADLPPLKRDEWADASESVKQGDVRVTIEGVQIGQVELKTIGGQSRSEDDLLHIDVRVENLSDHKKLEHRGWGDKLIFTDHPATLADDLGNRYKRIGFGFGTKVVGQVERGESIYPGKSVTDRLVFEEPVGKAAILKLELPAIAFGGEGMLRFKIPLSGNAAARPKPTDTPVELPQTAPKDSGKPAKVPSEQVPAEKASAKPALSAEQKAAAKLRSAKQLIRAGKKDTGHRWLNEIIEQHPETDAAKEASELLKK